MSTAADERVPLSHLRHDLRTPINQIIGYSELLMEEAADAGHAAYDPDLKKIQRAAKTLLGLINANLTDDRLTLSGAVVAAAACGRRRPWTGARRRRPRSDAEARPRSPAGSSWSTTTRATGTC